MLTKNSFHIFIHVLQDGSGKAQKKDESKAWYDLGKLEYCVEYKIYHKNRTQFFIMREPFQDPDGAETKSMYALVGQSKYICITSRSNVQISIPLIYITHKTRRNCSLS